MMKILILWLHISMFFLQYQTGFSFLTNNTIKNPLCHQEQRQILLQLKQQLPPYEYFSVFGSCSDAPKNYYKTKFWGKSSDCCLWDGITCDQSGLVIGLDLGCGGLSGEIDSNSSIFRLSHLRMLNLGYNLFWGSEISSEFRRLNRLTHLNLSSSGFVGQIALEFYHLSNLVSLDISSQPQQPRVGYCDIHLLFGNMTKIRVVVLVGVNISSEMPMNMSSFLTHLDLAGTDLYGNLPATIFEKPNLQILRLDGNLGLTGSLPKSLNRSNVHPIKELDVSFTSISGRLTESIGSMNNLNYMDLSNCKFSGPIPETIGNITDITYIDLSDNELSGQVPSTISNLRQLTNLRLSRNHLQGQIPDAFSDLQKLTSLFLANNYLEGLLPLSITNMSQLDELHIASNALTGFFSSGAAGPGLQQLSTIFLFQNSIQGMIPSWLLNLPSLQWLDLSYNRLTGLIGKFNCERLDNLDLSNNQLNFKLESFYNLSNIRSLSLSYNTMIKHNREIVNVTLPNLAHLQLSSCEIKQFPDFLRYLPTLQDLDLSNNKIHGPIPSWFASIPWQSLTNLNLSTNYLTHAGYLPWQKLENLQYLDLHFNLLQGTFPSSICNMTQLSLLNLSNNKLRGKIPDCIGNFSSQLLVIDLRRNEFNGKIPTIIAGADQLDYLGLNGNHFEGPLPRSLANCTELKVLDLGDNIMQDTFPWWLENLPQLKILILKSNRFHGFIRPPVSNDSFSELKIIDLSYNNFTGLLPEKLFTRLQAMKNQSEAAGSGDYLGSDNYQYSVTLSVKGPDLELTKVLSIFTTIDLSSNNFHGHIPESLAYLSSLRLLNLSHNSINGSIPAALGRMTKLEQLDLSSNQLTGGIPQTLTNLTFLAVLNLSQNHLVGPIPQVNQFPTFSNDSYVGNSGLCGAPLTKSCGDAPPSPIATEEDDDDDSGLMMGFTWKAVAMGYGCGIVLGFILGYVMISIGKPKWLARFVYVEAAICLNRRKKRGRMVQGRRRSN